MKFGLVLWANSGDSDPGQNPLQKQERERFLWSPKKCFSNLIPWMSVHSGTWKLEQPGVRERWYSMHRPPGSEV